MPESPALICATVVVVVSEHGGEAWLMGPTA
jgi:hypothetical protein